MAHNPEVDAWFAALDRPMKPEMLRIPEIILEADARIVEPSSGARQS